MEAHCCQCTHLGLVLDGQGHGHNNYISGAAQHDQMYFHQTLRRIAALKLKHSTEPCEAAQRPCQRESVSKTLEVGQHVSTMEFEHPCQ